MKKPKTKLQKKEFTHFIDIKNAIEILKLRKKDIKGNYKLKIKSK